jgi:hypothetical protein
MADVARRLDVLHFAATRSARHARPGLPGCPDETRHGVAVASFRWGGRVVHPETKRPPPVSTERRTFRSGYANRGDKI